MEEQSSLLEPQLRRSAEIYPPKMLWEARGGIFRIMNQRLLCQKGLDSQSPKGEDSPVSWRTLAHDTFQILLGFPVRLHGCPS